MTDTTNPPADASHLLSNKFYDQLKILALIVLPAFGVLYAGVAGIWGLPHAQDVLATVIVVDTFLGVVIKIGDASYNASEARFDGQLSVTPNPDGTGGTVDLDLKDTTDPEQLANDKGEVILKVKKTE